MTAIVDIRISTAEDSAITPIELLEEFADSTPTWSFLEEDTFHYRQTRGRPSCVLSHIRYQPFEIIDYAFTTVEDREDGSTRLVLIDANRRHTPYSVVEQDRLMRDFLTAFRAYVSLIHAKIDIVTEEEEVDPATSLSGI